jgi:hypothetical protein
MSYINIFIKHVDIISKICNNASVVFNFKEIEMTITFESTVFKCDKYRGDIEQYVDVEADVKIQRDIYATGDSPTGYEVTIKSVILHDHYDFDDGQDILSRLDPEDIEYFEEQAIEEVR